MMSDVLTKNQVDVLLALLASNETLIVDPHALLLDRLSATAVTRALGMLEVEGLVDRGPLGYQLTDAGRAAASRIADSLSRLTPRDPEEDVDG